jgi:hypothetical protein
MSLDVVRRTKAGVIVSYDRQAFLKVIELVHGEEVADQVRLASLPSDEKLHIEQHRKEDGD